jgi:uncharacterized protein YciI
MKKAIAFFSQPGPLWISGKTMGEQPDWEDHAGFFAKLFATGKIMLGGPMLDGSGSMVIFMADSIHEVRAIMREDPWAKRQILVERDIKEWLILMDIHDNA